MRGAFFGARWIARGRGQYDKAAPAKEEKKERAN